MFQALHNPNHQNYKRSICRHWKKNGGFCERGEFCNFAHGHLDLKKSGSSSSSVQNVVTAGTEKSMQSTLRASPLADAYKNIAGGYVKVKWEDSVGTK